MPSCCMLEPPYILNLTNIYLQVNYCLVKQWYFFPITRTQEDRNHIISEKNRTQPQIYSYNHLLLDPIKMFVWKENRIGLNTSAHK